MEIETDNEWMQLDLGTPMMVGGVATQPGYYTDSWVTTYKVSYSETGLVDDWTTLPDTFEGKESGSGVTKTSFSSPVLARYVKIHPKTAVKEIAMRADVLLAAQLSNISEEHRDYSSVYQNNSEYSQSKINSPMCWIAGNKSVDEWMQLDFGTTAKWVFGSATQGREDNNQYTSEYRVTYRLSEDDIWHDVPGTYQNGGQGQGLFESTFPYPVLARQMRLIPTKWDDHPCMRGDAIVLAGTTLTLADPPETERSYSTVWEDDQPGYNQARSRLSSELAWCSAVADDQQWMILNLGDKVRKVVGSVIAARADDFPQYVTSYKVSYSLTGDDGDWVEIPDFLGNGDRYGQYQSLFPYIVEARFVRLHPKTWVNAVSTRADVIIITGTSRVTPRVVATSLYT